MREYTSGLSENGLAGRRTDIFLIFASKQCRLHGQGRGNISHTGSDGRSNMGNDFRFDEAVAGRGDDAGRNHVLPLSDRLPRAETVQADFQTARKLAGRSAIRGGRPHGRLALFSDREHGPANNARLERSAAAGYRSDSDGPALETMARPQRANRTPACRRIGSGARRCRARRLQRELHSEDTACGRSAHAGCRTDMGAL